MTAKGGGALLEHGPGLEEVSIITKRQILAPWQEAVGVFHDLISDGGSLLATIGPLTVYLPLELEAELRPNVGKRIAILRTDDSARPYRFRLIGG